MNGQAPTYCAPSLCFCTLLLKRSYAVKLFINGKKVEFLFWLRYRETLDWYFELGDKVVDRMVVRDIFKVDEKVGMRAAIDAVLSRLHVMAAAFSDFAGYFIRHYAK